MTQTVPLHRHGAAWRVNCSISSEIAFLLTNRDREFFHGPVNYSSSKSGKYKDLIFSVPKWFSFTYHKHSNFWGTSYFHSYCKRFSLDALQFALCSSLETDPYILFEELKRRIYFMQPCDDFL